VSARNCLKARERSVSQDLIFVPSDALRYKVQEEVNPAIPAQPAQHEKFKAPSQVLRQ